MKNYRHTLPPLDSLVFFEAAARHMSFSTAAKELFVTQTAVSKRIQNLEQHLDLQLFERNGRFLELTAEGKVLLEQVVPLLEFAEMSLSRLSDRSNAPVRIAANSAVSLFWLAPRLKRFGLSDQACPVEIVTSDQPSTLLDAKNEIAILHGLGEWEGRVSIPLFPDLLVPIIAPKLAEQYGIVSGQSLSLLDPKNKPPLLNYSRVTPDWTNWDNWDGDVHLDEWDEKDCRTYAHSIGACLQGDGIALASPNILAAEIESGSLLSLGPTAQSTQYAYFLSYLDSKSPRRACTRVLEFLSR